MLHLQNKDLDNIQAQVLKAKLLFFEDGIIRLIINEEGGYENRFSISTDTFPDHIT